MSLDTVNGDSHAGELAEMRSLIQRMDQLLATPGLRAAVDVHGNPSGVAAGELIESAWGNSVKDRVVQKYATDDALRASTPPMGQMAVSTEGYASLFMTTPDLGWQRAITRAWANGTASAPSTGGNASLSFYEGKQIGPQDSWGIRVLAEGVYLVAVNCLFYGPGTAPGNQVIQAAIAQYNPSNPGTPYATTVVFNAPIGAAWFNMTVLQVKAFSRLDFWRLSLSGDAAGYSLDSRSTWHMARVDSY